MEKKKSRRLPLYRILAYCGLTFPITAVGFPVTTYMPPLYAGQVGLGLAAVGLIFMVARVWDIVTDPAVGILIDRFPSRWGRRKHWIALSVPLVCGAAWFAYMPARGADVGPFYLLASLLLLYTGYTFLQTAHQSWGPDLAEEYHERSRLYTWREAVNGLGTISVLALPALLATQIPVDEYTEVASMGLFLILTLPLTAVVALAFVPDAAVTSGRERPRVGARDLLRALNNFGLWRVLLIEISVGTAMGVTGATFLFVARGVVGFQAAASVVLLIYFVAGICGLPFWLWLARRIEKHNALLAAVGFALAGNLLSFPIVLYANQTVFVVLVAVLGLAFGAPHALLRAMMADQVDREEVSSGQNRAGFYFSFLTTAFKVGGALAVGLSFPLLALIGFEAADPGNPDTVIGLLLVYTGLPAVAYAVAALLCRRYPITRAVQARDRAALAERERGTAGSER